MLIKAFATLRDVLGLSRMELTLGNSAADVGDVLDRLVADSPGLREKLWDADGDLSGHITILLNGRSIEYLDGLNTPVADTDTIALFPPVGGG